MKRTVAGILIVFVLLGALAVPMGVQGQAPDPDAPVAINGTAYWATSTTGPDFEGVRLIPFQAQNPSRAAWEANAAYWDAHMGDAGNVFVNKLIWPAAQRLLDLRPAERVLDVGCGNGLYARRLAASGSEVVAFDFAAKMIERARRYEGPAGASITYHVLDATDEAALLGLGVGSFDAVLSCMALMDMVMFAPGY